MGMAPGVAWRPIAYYVTVTYARAAPVTNSPQSTDCTNQIWQHPILSSKNWLRYISQSSLTQRIWRDWGFGGYTKLKTSNLPRLCMHVCQTYKPDITSVFRRLTHTDDYLNTTTSLGSQVIAVVVCTASIQHTFDTFSRLTLIKKFEPCKEKEHLERD